MGIETLAPGAAVFVGQQRDGLGAVTQGLQGGAVSHLEVFGRGRGVRLAGFGPGPQVQSRLLLQIVQQARLVKGATTGDQFEGRNRRWARSGRSGRNRARDEAGIVVEPFLKLPFQLSDPTIHHAGKIARRVRAVQEVTGPFEGFGVFLGAVAEAGQ